MLFDSLHDFYNRYEMPLARTFHSIDRRGVLLDSQRLAAFIAELDSRLGAATSKMEASLGLKVIAQAPKGAKPIPGVLNLSSPSQLLKVLTDLKIPLKKERGASHASTNEESLQAAFAQTGNSVLKEILVVRELNKLRSTYASAETVDNVLYTIFRVAGTVSGRRASGETPFIASSGHRIGTNLQNIPKHSPLGKLFRGCIVARSGKVFVECDQVQAEDWIVQGIIVDNGGSDRGIQELRQGIDRHKRLASELFNKPKAECDRGTLFRFFGKKTRHAGNYDMGAYEMSVQLAKEGFNFGVPYCDTLLKAFHAAEPEIKNVFHQWVRDCLDSTRTLKTPIGRERYFFGLRPHADNGKIFKEAYSYVPQSTIGDNTGLAILLIERVLPCVVLDTHDAVTLEVDNNHDSILKACFLLQKAFDREITFPNGFSLKVPISYQVGFNLKDGIEFSQEDFQRLNSIIEEAKEKHEKT